MSTILCYGDSNTHGTLPLIELGQFARYPKGQRWPDVMAASLGPRFDVISEGLPGRTTVHDDLVEGGRRSGLEVLPAILGSHVPIDLMILMLGTNDLKPRFSVSAAEIARSLERLVTEARAIVNGLDILLVAPAPVLEAGVLRDIFEGAEAKQQALPRHIADAARRQGCGYFEAADHVTVSPVDGVHWEADGHRAFGQAIAQAVLSRVQMPRGRP
ncbi:SGNH/GDSL hydrolase family protein [Roseibacterium sp. SDUM158016]|jgi:lysophospholipase L1-like esterase|uniref:SGNH/GDSL hydrolase family protein n=1 Tax=Roseicyclus sediminis TaxID=2980997 RepID=UPI0021CFEBF4|nr:SGNH/GDSL hydrolase family protein [Roseibacterium sp. SDUM158016]MCU4654017.1 SGNH/GDSL hydrolase family protein [Roseibacterium sp. SDUM158016]